MSESDKVAIPAMPGDSAEAGNVHPDDLKVLEPKRFLEEYPQDEHTEGVVHGSDQDLGAVVMLVPRFIDGKEVHYPRGTYTLDMGSGYQVEVTAIWSSQ